MSVISFSRPHSNRPISSSHFIVPFLCYLYWPLFSVCSESSFVLFFWFPSFTLFPLFFFEFPCFPCVLCLSAFSLYSVFSPISLFPLTLSWALKRYPLTTSRKTTTTCVENVLTLTPECFHRHVFLLPLHSSLISAFSLYSVTSVISVTSAFYSPHFIVPFLYLL